MSPIRHIGCIAMVLHLEPLWDFSAHRMGSSSPKGYDKCKLPLGGGNDLAGGWWFRSDDLERSSRQATCGRIRRPGCSMAEPWPNKSTLRVSYTSIHSWIDRRIDFPNSTRVATILKDQFTAQHDLCSAPVPSPPRAPFVVCRREAQGRCRAGAPCV